MSKQVSDGCPIWLPTGFYLSTSDSWAFIYYHKVNKNTYIVSISNE